MMKRKKIIIVIILLLVGLVVLVYGINKSRNDTWQLNNPSASYVIQGVSNYGRGSTYYLYMEKNGKKQVILVDPESPVDFKHFTDRKVNISGKLVTKDNKSMIRISWIGLAN